MGATEDTPVAKGLTVWVETLWDQPMRWLQWGVVLSAALAAAVMDVRTGRIPNRLTGPLLVAGLGWSVCVGVAPGLADALAACLLLACPYVLLSGDGIIGMLRPLRYFLVNLQRLICQRPGLVQIATF